MLRSFGLIATDVALRTLVLFVLFIRGLFRVCSSEACLRELSGR